VVLLTLNANWRAILAGSEENPPTAQPNESIKVRFTWRTTLGLKSS
jgi:hypothetical protein